MNKQSRIMAITGYMEEVVQVLQAGIALFLVVVLVVGMTNLVATFVQAALAVELLGYKNAIGLISTTIDIVLYLFIVIELFRTIIAYVEAESVVRAVIHAGLIAVVRQIIIFTPGDIENTMEAFLTAGTFTVLLLSLLLGFYLVHRTDDVE